MDQLERILNSESAEEFFSETPHRVTFSGIQDSAAALTG